MAANGDSFDKNRTMDKISITHVKNTHNDWLRGLDFYSHELSILKDRLTEIGGKNTGAEVLKMVEHFENQFKVQIDNIDRLRHDINLNIQGIATQAETAKAGYIDNILLTRHNTLRVRYEEEEKAIRELRADFMRFSAEWM
jgi:hypothetical protein